MMQEIRSYLMSVAVTLILTGILGRLAPENSNKSLIRFIITAVVFVSIFGIGINPESFTEIPDLTTEIYRQEELESEISSAVYERISNGINGEISKIVMKHCPSAEASVEFSDASMTVNVNYNGDMNVSDKKKIENEIRSCFDGVIIFEYKAVTE